MDVNQRLSFLVKLSNIEGIKSALRDGADANYRGGYLLRDVQYHYYDISEPKEALKILLDGGADPNYVMPGGEPILSHAAAGNSNGEMVEMLLKAGADPNVSYNEYQSVLHDMLDYKRITRGKRFDKNIKLLCQVTNYDEVERLKKEYPKYVHLLNCQMPKASMGAVETALDRAAAKMHPELQDGVELPNVMKNVKDYVGYKNVGPGGKRNTKKRKSYKKKTKKRK